MTATSPAALTPNALDPLPLGAIRPVGWLRDQLRTQADGLSGHLDEFWPDVADSGWVGGDAEGWERGPYWLDGMVPLAVLLGDERLLVKVRRWVDHIFDGQRPDGWLGPTYHRLPVHPDTTATHSEREFDPWPRAILGKALAQWHEATGDERVIPALTRFYAHLAGLIEREPLFSWGRMRWQDLAIGVHWLHGQTGDPALLALADRLHAQGFDWDAQFRPFPYHDRLAGDDLDLPGHGPNNAMAIRDPAVRYRQTGDPADLALADRMMAELDRWHGQATGMFTCDEHLAGRNPSQGSELCAVVEYQYSLEVLLAAGGHAPHADRLESLTFNALPSTFSPDMWTHQYDQQVNQVAAKVVERPIYTSNFPDANVYGLEPHYGCCTANMHQGWPKFVSHLWMRPADGGLAAVAWAPCEVETTVAGRPVRVTVETAYPFDETITVRVRDDGATAGDDAWPLSLRIPGWAEGARVRVDDGDWQPATPGTFHRVELSGGDHTVELVFPMPVRPEDRDGGGLTLWFGPLLLALPIGERWETIVERETVSDFAVLPTTPWNYALDCASAAGAAIERRPVAPGRTPFAPDDAPVRVAVRGRRLPGWGLDAEHEVASPPPTGPQASDEPDETLHLVPFGCTCLRIGEFPVLAPGGA